MEALITLYTRACGIEAEKLQMIEDIETYLSIKESTAPTYTIQYQKIRLNMFVKVILDEKYSSPLMGDNFTYVKITNKDNLTKHFYYFVKSLNWKSQNCIELELVMDTLNSFKMGVDYTFSPKTIIQRQHKDRMKYKREKNFFISKSVNFDGSGGKEKFKNNTLYILNFGTAVDLFDSYSLPNSEQKFFMLSPSNFTCFFFNRNTHETIYGTYDPLSPNYFGLGDIASYNWFLSLTQEQRDSYVEIHLPNYTPTKNYNAILLIMSDYYYIVLNANDSDCPYLGVNMDITPEPDEPIPPAIQYRDHGEITTQNPFYPYAEAITHEVKTYPIILRLVDLYGEELYPLLYHREDYKSAIYDKRTGLTTQWWLWYVANSDTPTAVDCYLVPSTGVKINYLGTSYTTAKTITDIDRTLSTNIKLIKIPYFPSNVSINNADELVLDGSVWEYLPLLGLIHLKGLSGDFLNSLLTTEPSPNNVLVFNTDQLQEFTLEQNRNDLFESKMYHSEFYMDKFVYDSFALPYKMELIDIDEWEESFLSVSSIVLQATASITFKMTNTINSRFGFKFGDYVCGDKAEIDYHNFLLIQRNNEEVLYNSEYLNYIRTGFNYDVKNKNTRNAVNWIGFGGSLLATAVGIAGSVVSGGSSVPLAIMGVSGVISSIGTLTNAISSTITNERTIDQKKQQLENQATQVTLTDDINLLEWYQEGAKSQLWRTLYKPSARVDKLLKDLFYYYGYKDNISGVPSLNTRRWFNFLKCEPILDFSSINMTQEIEDELKGIMRIGFTYYHKVMVNNTATWDINQEKENWEVSMLPYLN